MLRGTLSDNLRQAWSLIRKKGLFLFLAQDGRDFLDRLAVQWRARHYLRGFHRLYYHAAYNDPPQSWGSVSWLGIPTQKCHLDLCVYQEIVYETRPAVIIETGTAAGGSALFLASLCDLLGQGEVITVDIEDKCQLQHPRITRLLGSSTDPAIVGRIRERVQGRPAMVILDSDHSKEHVLAELEAYSPFVPVGFYLIIEDSNVHGHPVGWRYGEGPTEALQQFLQRHADFVVDRGREKHLLTFNPGGFLRRAR